MSATMTNKKKSVKKAAIFAEIPEDLKKRVEGWAEKHHRKLNGEIAQALEEYVDRLDAEEEEDTKPTH